MGKKGNVIKSNLHVYTFISSLSGEDNSSTQGCTALWETD